MTKPGMFRPSDARFDEGSSHDFGGATLTKKRPPLDKGGLGAVTHNLVWVVDRGTHPGASRQLSLRATPPTEGILGALCG